MLLLLPLPLQPMSCECKRARTEWRLQQTQAESQACIVSEDINIACQARLAGNLLWTLWSCRLDGPFQGWFVSWIICLIFNKLLKRLIMTVIFITVLHSPRNKTTLLLSLLSQVVQKNVIILFTYILFLQAWCSTQQTLMFA